jgi:flavin reductase (DIM6/NTAB) family NADH-FMN oxidoreductase RutF
MSDRPAALFRRLATGVYVIGVAHEGRSNAFTAAWLTQVSFDPLLVALSVNPGHASYPLLQKSKRFSVSVLRQGQIDVARHFGTQSGRQVDKLADVGWRPGRLGAPILLDAAAYLECRVTGSMAAGDHQLVVGQVIGGAVLDEAVDTLRYADTGNLDGSAELYPPSF